MKHLPYATANALASTVGIVYVVCRLVIGIFPDIAMSITQSWFHGLELSKSGWNLPTESFFLGFISAIISAWIIGYIFASAYNIFVKRV